MTAINWKGRKQVRASSETALSSLFHIHKPTKAYDWLDLTDRKE